MATRAARSRCTTRASTSTLGLVSQYSEKLANMPNTFFIGNHKQMFLYLGADSTFARAEILGFEISLSVAYRLSVMFKAMWASNGNELSKIYAGTGPWQTHPSRCRRR